MPYTTENYPGTRSYICDSSHASLNYHDMGPLEVYICADPVCAKVIARCTHSEELFPDNKSICKWNEEGTILSCTFCGKDVT
jgi:hypothetical protein